MKDLSFVVGKTYGNLVVLHEIPTKVQGHRMFLTQCSCGRFHEAIWNNLNKGSTTQCKECATTQRNKSLTRKSTVENRREYNSYTSMIERCYCENHASYSNYGGRGIDVCEDWLCKDFGFSTFLKEMGKRPDGFTLDRIDVNKGYCKDNCRWADIKTQSHNKRKRKASKDSRYIGVCKDGNTWVMQFMVDKVKTREPYRTEIEAAIAYDNLSELYFGDRPNGTKQAVVEVAKRKRGGISIRNGGKSFVVRITGLDGVRRQVGRYKTREEAETALDEALKDM